jgi:hypothetical protein
LQSKERRVSVTTRDNSNWNRDDSGNDSRGTVTEVTVTEVIACEQIVADATVDNALDVKQYEVLPASISHLFWVIQH